jgi:hypothetical protein
MSLAELKEAVVALSSEEHHQLRDVLDALEEGVTVEQLLEIDHMLDEAINDKSPSIPAEQVWAEMKMLLGSLPKKTGSI